MSVEDNQKPLLIVDKKGILARVLIRELSRKSSLVVASASRDFASHEKVIFVPFLKNSPRLPDLFYAKTLIVYNGEKELQNLLSGFLKKTEYDKSILVVAAHASFLGDRFITQCLSNGDKIMLAVYGDIIGEGFMGEQQYLVNRYLNQALSAGRIEVANQGTDPAFPVSEDQILESLLSILDGVYGKHGVFLLIPRHPPTQLRLAHAIQKIDPLIRIDFVAKRKTNDSTRSFLGTYVLSEGTVQKALSKLYLSAYNKREHVSLSLSKKNNSSVIASEHKNQKSHKFFYFILLFILGLLVVPSVTTFSLLFAGVRNLYQAGKLAEAGKINEALVYSKTATKHFGYAEYFSSGLLLQGSIVDKRSETVEMQGHIRQAKKISSAFTSLLDSIRVYTVILEANGGYAGEDAASVINGIRDAYILFQSIKAQSNDGAVSQFLKVVPFWKSFYDKWDKIDVPAEYLGSVLDVFPDVLGFGGKKTYLVLFQNNMELRPGGGFIGSYGLVELTNGKISSFSIHNVYDADGQLKGHVEPPFPIRRYLPSVHWFLRDSNFDPDFVKSASSSANLFFLETEEVVDGVIGVDVAFVKSLLSHIDPVYVPEYDLRVTEENMYKLVQEHADNDSFPGSRQKQDFLTSLFHAMQKSMGTKEMSYLDLFKSAEEMIEQKHLLFAFSDKSIQRPFTIAQMSSSLDDLRGTGKDEIKDFLGISEANLGVNKANYFIKRKVDYTVAIRDTGLVFGNVAISYKNTSDQWPGGDYKNYLRLILPKTAQLKSISINGKDQEITQAITDSKIYEAKRFVPPSKFEVDRVEEGSYVSYGFLVNVAQGEYKTLNISYVLGRTDAIFGQSFIYDLWFYKQPGTEDYPFSLNITYPKGFVFDESAEKSSFQNTEGNVRDSNVIVTDQKYRLRFLRQ